MLLGLQHLPPDIVLVLQPLRVEVWPIAVSVVTVKLPAFFFMSTRTFRSSRLVCTPAQWTWQKEVSETELSLVTYSCM